MSINISKIENEKYRNIAMSVDRKENGNGNGNGYLDSSEISVFCAKVNESLPEDKKVNTFLELAELLGFKKINAKANSRTDFDIVKKLPESENEVTADNVVYVLTEYKNRNGEYYQSPVILAKLEEKAKVLGVAVDDNDKSVATLVDKLINATDNTYIVEEPKKDGVDKIVHMGDAELSVSEIFYNDGRVVLSRNGEKLKGTINSLVTVSENSIIAQRGVEEEAVPINVVLPYNASETVQKMAVALTENKAELMDLLKIDNKTYDKYVSFTLALMERETNFGEGCVVYNEDIQDFEISKSKYQLQRYVAQDDFSAPLLSHMIRLGAAGVGDPVSFGMSGIKWDAIVNCTKTNKPDAKFYKEVLNGFKKFDINSREDLYNPEKCAIATLIYASKHAEILEVLCENDTNVSRKITGNYNLASRVKAAPNGHNATEFDIVANMWNRGPSFILDGTLDINWEHTKTVRENMKKYQVLTSKQIEFMCEEYKDESFKRNIDP